MYDAWIVFSCVSFRLLVMFMLPHCHTGTPEQNWAIINVLLVTHAFPTSPIWQVKMSRCILLCIPFVIPLPLSPWCYITSYVARRRAEEKWAGEEQGIEMERTYPLYTYSSNHHGSQRHLGWRREFPWGQVLRGSQRGHVEHLMKHSLCPSVEILNICVYKVKVIYTCSMYSVIALPCTLLWLI